MSIPSADHSGSGAPAGTAKIRQISARELLDPKVHRKFWLGALTQGTDAWFRSNVFLKLMRVGLKTTIRVKRLQDGIATNLIPRVRPSTPVSNSKTTLDPSSAQKEG